MYIGLELQVENYKGYGVRVGVDDLELKLGLGTYRKLYCQYASSLMLQNGTIICAIDITE